MKCKEERPKDWCAGKNHGAAVMPVCSMRPSRLLHSLSRLSLSLAQAPHISWLKLGRRAFQDCHLIYGASISGQKNKMKRVSSMLL